MRYDAEGGTRTRTGRPTRPSNVRVYQFHHFGDGGMNRSLSEDPIVTRGRSRGQMQGRRPEKTGGVFSGIR